MNIRILHMTTNMQLKKAILPLPLRMCRSVLQYGTSLNIKRAILQGRTAHFRVSNGTSRNLLTTNNLAKETNANAFNIKMLTETRGALPLQLSAWWFADIRNIFIPLNICLTIQQVWIWLNLSRQRFCRFMPLLIKLTVLGMSHR